MSGPGGVRDIAVREATVADLAAVMAIERASFPTDAWSEAAMSSDIASPHTYYVVAESATGVHGYAGLRALEGAADGDVQTIAVGAAARGSGLGRVLLRELITEADHRGVRDLFLDVRDDNGAAQALYLSEGFAQIGRRAHYYQPDDVDALVMRLRVPAWRIARRDGVTV